MKSIRFPYLPNLEESIANHNVENIISTLDAFGERKTIESLNWSKRYPYHPLSAVFVAHTGRHLCIDFFVRCNYLRAENFTNQSPVSEDSCVEFFVSPTSDNHYWNFEFNCIGAVNASQRSERKNPTRLTDAEIERILRHSSCGNRPFCELEGLFSWNLLVVIPLDLIGVEFKGEDIKMRGNFYKCASATSAPHYLSWNPIRTPEPDFHRPEFFGEIILSGKGNN